MRLRTLRRAAERAGEELVERPPEQNRHARRQVWHERIGAKDKKDAVDLVGVDFGFKEEAEHEYTIGD